MVAYVLRLDEDLSPFYELAAEIPDLAWATAGAGRLIRNPAVFEEVVKTICTTNCAWSRTVRMVSALVEHLSAGRRPVAGTRPLGTDVSDAGGVAAADLGFYKDVVRAGYRGAYLQSLAQSVASGELDLEAFPVARRAELPDDELAAELLALPGVGPWPAR